jgi:hypothetical protein
MLLSHRNLAAKSNEELIQIYTAAASEHGRASLASDYKTGNPAAKIISNVYAELKNRKRVTSLEPLLSDSDPSVASWAATHLLPFSAKKATDTLERISKSNVGIIAFNAKIVLQDWRRGELY